MIESSQVGALVRVGVGVRARVRVRVRVRGGVGVGVRVRGSSGQVGAQLLREIATE